MIKHILITVVLTLSGSSFLYSQSSNGLSSGLLYSNYLGLQLEMTYKKNVTKKIGLSARVSGNINGSFGLRSGLLYTLMNTNKWELSTGLEYNFDRAINNDFSFNESSHNLEIPFSIDYSLSQKLNLYTGFSPSLNLNSVEDHNVIDNLRVGIRYGF